tara:strand:- start:11486 stop:13024 length:1539 start_codon:yes stop_codon:yes gene_type:complete
MDTVPKYIDRTPFGYFQLFSYSCIIIIITVGISIYFMKKKWKENWDYYRCKGYIIPFTSLVNEDETVTSNYNYCYDKNIKPILEVQAEQKLHAKMEDTANTNSKVAEGIGESNEEASKIKEETTNGISVFIELYQRLKSISGYMMTKIQHFFLKIGAITWVVYYQLITQMNVVLLQIAILYKTIAVTKAVVIIVAIIGTIFLHPPAVVLSAVLLALSIDLIITDKASEQRAYCCFTKESKILTDIGEKCISDIHIGEKLKDNEYVTGTIILKNTKRNIRVYNISNVQVTGDHFILDNKDNTWKSVCEYMTDDTKYICTDTIYSLITTNNLIQSPGYTFRDYEETKDTKIQSSIAIKYLCYLNSNNSSNKVKEEYENGEQSNCVAEGTLICMENGRFQKIENIKIGDITSCGVVSGIYKCDGKYVNWFNYNGNIIGSRVILRSDDMLLWDKTYNVGENIKYESCNYGYHLITSKAMLELEEGVILRDFVELPCDNIQDDTFEMIQDHLNSLKS